MSGQAGPRPGEQHNVLSLEGNLVALVGAALRVYRAWSDHRKDGQAVA